MNYNISRDFNKDENCGIINFNNTNTTASDGLVAASTSAYLELNKIATAPTSEVALTAAAKFGAFVEAEGIEAASKVGSFVQVLLNNKKNAYAREGGLAVIRVLAVKVGLSTSGLILPLVGSVLVLAADKKSPQVREGAIDSAEAVLAMLPADSVPVFVLESLCAKKGALSTLAKWQTKVLALKLLSAAALAAPIQIAAIMPSLVPIVSENMWDTKAAVKTQARFTMEACCAAIDNMDLKPFIPALIEAITNPAEVSECVYALAGTTFVQTVTASALSITVPVLARGFTEKKTAIVRKCAVITENMAKLVEKAADVAPFMPILEPALLKGLESISDPECRARFAAAHEVLTGVSELGLEASAKATIAPATLIKELIDAGATPVAACLDVAASVASSLCSPQFNFVAEAWALVLTPILKPCFAEGKAEEAARNLCAFAQTTSGVTEADEYEDEDDGEDASIPDLCDLKFSLAYGSNILLNNSRLHLKKGFKYGIIANKSAGKTTLLRAISNNQVDGFPTATEMRAIFVENDIAGSQAKMNTVQYLLETIGFGLTPTLEVARKMLLETGNFTERMCDGPVSSLSGGWRMKLALMRAVMQKAQIMLMDEPTNHLDVINVQWVVDYLNSLPDVTCMIVSHDTAFLDKTVDHILHFDRLKLNTYRGNITDFVARFPDAASYFDLKNTRLKFHFPTPGPLQSGTRNRGRTLIEMKGVYFKYPGCEEYQIKDVNVKASMASRVAIVGANGAGKSTMIKVFTGENKATKGAVKTHPNLRFAYVAQHAFHHIEQHLDKAPNEYICWRYQGGGDKEALVKSTMVLSEKEEADMKMKWDVTWKDKDNGKMMKEKRVLEKIFSRRKERKVFVYECKWEGKAMKDNTWMTAERMAKMGTGFAKLVKAMDMRIAAQESMMARPLTERNVEEHCAAVGLSAEQTNHCRLKDLSGGQKVKVVLAACTWACPHLIILDEPTNYLDRDSLGALANAIEEFEGGVVLITHNKEFADATTRETWVVANNRLDVSGDPEWEKYAAEAIEDALEEETKDAMGNIVKKKDIIPELEDMTRKQIKKHKKICKEKIKRNEELELHELVWCEVWGIETPDEM